MYSIDALDDLLLMLIFHNKIVPAVSRIALVKPDKARGVENMILAAAQRGQLGEKVRRFYLSAE
jgi:programmed cell death protein 5